MLIIIEGSDPDLRATATTGLLNLLGDVSALTPDEAAPDWVARYVNPLLDYQPNDGHGVPGSPSHVVCDRWFWETDGEPFDYISRFLNVKGALIVHLWNEASTQADHEAAALSRVPVLHVHEVTSSRISQIMTTAQTFERAAAEMYPAP